MALDYPVEIQALLNDQSAVAVRVGGTYKSTCPNCGDIGYVYVFKVKSGPWPQPPLGETGRGSKWLEEGPNGRGWYAGSLEAAACPACKSSRLADWLISKCGLRGADLAVTLADYHAHPGKEEARSAAAMLLSQGRQVSGFYTMYGYYGRGKSMLLKCLVNGFRLMNVFAVYVRLSDLLAAIRERYGERGESAESVIEYFSEVRCLCIDEVDKVRLTDWAKETIFRFMDARHNAKGELLTVLAMNCEPWNLPLEMAYLSSRISGGVVVKIAGDDMRPAGVELERKDWE